MTDKENNEEMVNVEVNGRTVPNGMSKLFENDIEGFEQTFAQFKASGLVNQTKPGNLTNTI